MATIQKINGKKKVSYKIIVSIGCINGKWERKTTTYSPITTTKTGKPRSEKAIMQDVEEFARQFEQECKDMPNLEKRLTVKQLSERWLTEYCEMQLSPTTINSYRQHLNLRILPRFGSVKICDVTPYNIQKFVNEVFNTGERLDGKKEKT